MSDIRIKTINIEELKNKNKNDAMNEYQDCILECKEYLRKQAYMFFGSLCSGLILVFVILSAINYMCDLYLDFPVDLKKVLISVFVIVGAAVGIIYFLLKCANVYNFCGVIKEYKLWLKKYENDFEQYYSDEYCQIHRYKSLLCRLFTESNDCKLMKIQLSANKENRKRPYLNFEYEEHSYVKKFKKKFKLKISTEINTVMIDLVNKTITVPYDFDLSNLYSLSIDTSAITENKYQVKSYEVSG